MSTTRACRAGGASHRRDASIRGCVLGQLVLPALLAASWATGAAGAESSATVTQAIAQIQRGDCEGGVAALKKGAESGDGAALQVLGSLLERGECVNLDTELAAQFYAQAVEKGDRIAARRLAALYGTGRGVPRDFARAGQLIRKSDADLGAAVPDDYTAGYVATLRELAFDRTLRMHAEELSSTGGRGAVRIQFVPATGSLNAAASRTGWGDDAPTGSNLPRGRREVVRGVESSWRDAMQRVGAPDPAQISPDPVHLEMRFDLAQRAPTVPLEFVGARLRLENVLKRP
jgi:hypothetical protein